MYITWKPNQIDGCCYQHPNTNGHWETNGEGTFTETGFTDGNGIFIGILDNPTIPTNDFQIVEKTEEEVNSLLLGWYGVDVTVSNGVFSDNRPTDI